MYKIRTYKKTSLPENVIFNGEKLNFNPSANSIQDARQLKTEGKTVVLVEVRNPKLKGKTDLHGQPYTPNLFIFTN